MSKLHACKPGLIRRIFIYIGLLLLIKTLVSHLLLICKLYSHSSITMLITNHLHIWLKQIYSLPGYYEPLLPVTTSLPPASDIIVSHIHYTILYSVESLFMIPSFNNQKGRVCG